MNLMTQENRKDIMNYNGIISVEQKENSLRMNNCSRPNFGKYISKASLSGTNSKHSDSNKTSFVKIPKSSIYSTIEEGQSSYSQENTQQKCRKKQKKYLENLKCTLALENNNREIYDIPIQFKGQNCREVTPLVQTFDPRKNDSLFDTSSFRDMRGRFADSDYNKSTQRTHQEGDCYLALQEVQDGLRTPNSYLIRPDPLSESKQDDDSDEVSSEIVLLRQKLTDTEAECHKWKRCAEIQNERILALELDICASKKEIRKTHKKILKYKQLKEHSDSVLKKQSELQRETVIVQAAKIKEMFLKEYEELIIEKNSEIKRLNEIILQSQNERSLMSHQKINLEQQIENLKQEIKLKDEQIKKIEVLESKAKINPILKEGLLNMEKCNKMSSNLLTQYKEHILNLANTNSNMCKKLKSLSNIEEKYEETKQQNELYEKELEALEENVRLFESQLDRKQCLKVQTECELLCNEATQLLECIEQLMKGGEPNVNLLLGFAKQNRDNDDENLVNKEMSKTFDEIKSMRKKIFKTRNILCDHFATKYSSECNVQ